MYEDIRKQFYPMGLPYGVTAHSMDRQTAQETIESFNDRIFPPGFKEETGAFRPPQVRGERVGLEINESAGPILKVAHLLHEDRQRGFERVFCMVPEARWSGTLPVPK